MFKIEKKHTLIDLDLCSMVGIVHCLVVDVINNEFAFYNQEHPDISKADKKKICSLVDVKKLSPDASIHATQNDRLPLRLVVQVLFFQQLRAGSSKELALTDNRAHDCIPPMTDQCDPCERRIPKHPNSLNKQVTSLSARESEHHRISEHRGSRNSFKDQLGGLLLQSRSRRIFDKLWSAKGQGEHGGKGSETSGSSQSPPLSAKPTEVKPSPLPPLRNRRYSVS